MLWWRYAMCYLLLEVGYYRWKCPPCFLFDPLSPVVFGFPGDFSVSQRCMSLHYNTINFLPRSGVLLLFCCLLQWLSVWHVCTDLGFAFLHMETVLLWIKNTFLSQYSFCCCRVRMTVFKFLTLEAEGFLFVCIHFVTNNGIC